jgi:predicted metalloprotease
MRLDDYDNNIDVEDQRGQRRLFLCGGGGGGFPLGLILSLVGSRFGILGILLVSAPRSCLAACRASLSARSGKPRRSRWANPAAKRWPRPATSTLSATKAATRCLRSTRRGSHCWPRKTSLSARPSWCSIPARAAPAAARRKARWGRSIARADQGIYIDTDFYTELDKKLGAGGDFARVYVMAHEYGHHIQKLVGTSAKVTSAQRANPDAANALSVRLELQADCYAGVWAAQNRARIEPGDVEEGLRAAHQIGDDTLMKAAGRTPVKPPSPMAARSSAWPGCARARQRQPGACNTFADGAV